MDNLYLDISTNRKASRYSRNEMVRRILWGAACPLFRLIPRPFFGWRSSLLRLFGARIGKGVHIYGSATIYMPWNLAVGDSSAIGEHAYIYNLGPVVIGCRTTISQRAHLCAGTHDYNDPALPLLKLPVTIKDQAWVCTDAFVGPGVTVGEGAIVGARAVVTKDVNPWTIVAGNPASLIKHRKLNIGSSE